MVMGLFHGLLTSCGCQSDSLFFIKRGKLIFFWWLKQLLYCWQRSNYKAYNGMEVFLLLLVISRCAEVDVLCLDFMGVQLLIPARLLFFPYLNAIYSLTFPH